MELGQRKFYVKYMVSDKCKSIVKSEIRNLGLSYKLTINEALEFQEALSVEKHEELKKALLKSGLVLLEKNESIVIDKIINNIIETIHYSDALPNVSYFDVFDDKSLNGRESILKVFSDVKGMSILQFIVVQKIERSKELLLYGDMSITEISERLKYKNKYYFVAQFKKLTGLTPSYFRRLKEVRGLISRKRHSYSQLLDHGHSSNI